MVVFGGGGGGGDGGVLSKQAEVQRFSAEDATSVQ